MVTAAARKRADPAHFGVDPPVVDPAQAASSRAEQLGPWPRLEMEGLSNRRAVNSGA
jgi:hypothetical protein